VKYTYRQRLALRRNPGRMRTARLRKKLLKYPERYVRLRGYQEMLAFQYTDGLTEMMTPTNPFLYIIPKDSWKGAHVPIPLVFGESSHGEGDAK
jgi:hypothetical protein